MGCSFGSVSEAMGATKPTSSSGSKPKVEKTDADVSNQVQGQSAPGAKTAVEEEHHERLTKHEQTIASLGSRMDSHADAAREILETVAAMPQRLRDLEAEVVSLKDAVAAAAAAAEASMRKSKKSKEDPLESVRAELKAAETEMKVAEDRATRGAEALAESMKSSAMLQSRVQALEGLMQDVLMKTSKISATPQTATTLSDPGGPPLHFQREGGDHQSGVAESISSSFANPGGPPLHFQRDGGPVDFSQGLRGVPPPWAQPGYREFASGQLASPGFSSPMGTPSPIGSPAGSTRGTGLPSAPKLTPLVPERPPARRPGTCSAWWS